MLQKSKNKLRLLKDKWQNWGKCKKFFLIATIIALIVGIYGIKTASNLPYVLEENYSAMHELVQTIIKEKSTDVKFDTFRISSYTVDNKSNGIKKIVIYGKELECMRVSLNDNYQIIELDTESSTLLLGMFYVFYFIVMYALGCIATAIIFGLFSLIKKIVKFFKE